MRIGIDGRFFGPGTGTGLGRYTQRLLEEFDEMETNHTFVVFLRPDNINEFRPKHEGRFEKVLAPWRWYSLGEQLAFPRLIARSKLDLMHFPHFNVPLFTRVPFIVTVHDLILSKFPTERASTLEPYIYWAKHRAYLAVIRSALRRAKHIIAVSENTKRDICDSYSLASDRVTVTYEACDLPGDRETAGVDVRERFRITKPFIMYVGNSYPHKNLERLVEASITLAETGLDHQLVLVGREDFFSQRLQRETRERFGNRAEQTIRFIGYVDDRILNTLYTETALYAFPSLYEGFGLPGLEAMARGVPVVAARASCLPEVFGEAAEYFDPLNVSDIVATIKRVMESKELQARLRTKGFEQVRKYSWKRMAEQTLDVYNGATSSRTHEHQ